MEKTSLREKVWQDKFNTLQNSFSRQLDIYLNNVVGFRHLGTSLKHQNCKYRYTRRRTNSGNVCYNRFGKFRFTVRYL